MAKRATGDNAVRTVRAIRDEVVKGSAGYAAFAAKPNTQADAMIEDFRAHVVVQRRRNDRRAAYLRGVGTPRRSPGCS
jgi:hypothetical protein